jgi:hypothetical protein
LDGPASPHHLDDANAASSVKLAPDEITALGTVRAAFS